MRRPPSNAAARVREQVRLLNGTRNLTRMLAGSETAASVDARAVT